MRIEIIYETGRTGARRRRSQRGKCRKTGMKIVLKEGYSATRPTCSRLVTTSSALVPTCCAYRLTTPTSRVPRQATEQGLKLKAMVGHGAGHSQIDKAAPELRRRRRLFHSIDPAAPAAAEPEDAQAGHRRDDARDGSANQEVKGPGRVPADTSPMGSTTLDFLSDVLPRAIRK